MRHQRTQCYLLAVAWLGLLAAGCSGPGVERADTGIGIEFNDSLYSRVDARFGGRQIEVAGFGPSEFISISSGDVKEFSLTARTTERVQDEFGAGRRTIVRGTAPGLQKVVRVTIYDEFPLVAVFEVEYTNTGSTALQVSGWTNHAYAMAAGEGAVSPAFWSFQSGSYEHRPDWVLPLTPGFQQHNFLGMNESDYGGGTPVADVWRPDVGLGVGHLETVPKLVSLPVAMPVADRATLAVEYEDGQTLEPGATVKTFRTFVAVHQGDYFQTLSTYRRLMGKQGFRIDQAPDDAYAPIWCAWGYGRDFTPAQVYGALPIVKEMGFRWVTLDDGWQTAEGDWFLNPAKFPNGDADIKAMVDRIHTEGFKAQLWWAPLAADPGTELLRLHPEQLLLNADGSKQKITWWDAWYLCPADPDVVQYHRDLVVKIMKVWGFDGLKLDGQHMNAVPPCYNPAHHHARPQDAVEAVPGFFRAIYDTAREINPEALVEFCPCGTSYSSFTLPFMNMSVASDPTSSWQVRSKGKTLKALAGDEMAYFGDHVEMTDGGEDFASTVGIGGVVGTNFTWPPGSGASRELDLTPEKEATWKKWLGIYQDKMLSRGEYLGSLYDIGFDRPEAHAIKKDGNYYYAFFAEQFSGTVELRGLAALTYHVTDYSNNRDLGMANGPVASLDVEFTKHLLLEVKPE